MIDIYYSYSSIYIYTHYLYIYIHTYIYTYLHTWLRVSEPANPRRTRASKRPQLLAVALGLVHPPAKRLDELVALHGAGVCGNKSKVSRYRIVIYTRSGVKSRQGALRHNTKVTPDPRLVASPALSHIRNVETPCGCRPEVGFNTCSETSELSASRRYSCLFCTHITSFSHIRNVETPCGRRPEVGFNTCSEMSRQAACRRYSCPHITSFSR